MLYGGIDIGSNAVRLLICESQHNRRSEDLKKILFVRVPVRLGVDLNLSGRISTEKKRKLKHTITAFQNLLKAYDVIKYRACATASLRLAANGSSIAKYITRECDIEIEIISGKSEAELIHGIHHPQIMKKTGVYLCMDVGGGSTELTLIKDGKIVNLESFPIGTLALRNKSISKEMKQQIRRWITDSTKGFKNIDLLGTGGNINSASKILGKSIRKPISYDELNSLRSDLESFGLKKRMELYDLREDRADVIVPALNLYLLVMELANSKKIFVPKTGLADGIIYSLLC